MRSAAWLAVLALGSAARSPLSGVSHVEVTAARARAPRAARAPAAHPLSDIPGELPGVVAYGYVANQASSAWPQREWIALHCDFSAPARVRLTGMMGSVRVAGRAGPAIQNLTLVPLDNALVEPGEVVELRYNILPSAALDPVAHRVAATVFYDDERESFATTFFNRTVLLLDGDAPPAAAAAPRASSRSAKARKTPGAEAGGALSSNRTLVAGASAAALVVLVAYYFANGDGRAAGKKGKRKPRPPPPPPRTQAGRAKGDEWMEKDDGAAAKQAGAKQRKNVKKKNAI